MDTVKKQKQSVHAKVGHITSLTVVGLSASDNFVVTHKKHTKENQIDAGSVEKKRHHVVA